MYSVGIVGATGAVGQEILKLLDVEHDKTTNTNTNIQSLPVSSVHLFGSSRSQGKTMTTTKFGTLTIQLFDCQTVCETCQIVFLAVSGSFALEHAPKMAQSGTIVIDNSSAFRYDPQIPLVVPEINGNNTVLTKDTKLIANPNCTTAIAVMALYPLLTKFGMKRLLVSTYQAASGAGQPGMEELITGTQQYLEQMKSKDKDDATTTTTTTATNQVFAHPLPFNVIPHIDKFQDNLYTKEEMKVTWETRKICGLDENIPISCTAVRIPTLRAHSEVIVMETKVAISDEELMLAKQLLQDAPGIDLVDDPSNNVYPMPLTATRKHNVEVGRLRKSLAFAPNGLEFFVCGDQLLRGAALNAVLIAEAMHRNGCLG